MPTRISLLFLLLSLARSLLLSSLSPFSLVSSLPNTGLTSAACAEKLKTMASRFLSDPEVAAMLQYSGKGPNDMGDYLGCRDLAPGSYYLKITVVVGGFPGLNLALCLPKECSVEDMEVTKGKLADILSGVAGFKLTPEQIYMSDVAENNKTFNQAGTGFYVCIGLTLLVSFIVVLSTVLDYNKLMSDQPDTIPAKLVTCFSLKNSLRGVFSSTNRVDPKLEILNGVRALSIGWVVFGHTFFYTVARPVYNAQDLIHDAFESLFMGVVKAGTYAVDTFFFLSGFLAALGLYKALAQAKNRTIGNVLLAYALRYMRLFPVFLVTLLYTVYVQPALYDGPVANYVNNQAKYCEEQWHYCLLYINNFMSDVNAMCIGWVWYLCNDMQFFLILPFIVIIYHKNKMFGLLTILMLCLGSFAVQFALGYHYSFDLSFARQSVMGEQTNIFYIKPYCRLNTYFMGVLLYLIYEEGKNPATSFRSIAAFQSFVHDTPWFRYPFYVAGALLTWLMVYSFYYIDVLPKTWGLHFGVLHLVFSRPLFILGLCMVLYPVLIGKGKVLLAVIGHSVCNFFGKLNYGIYMWHMAVITIPMCSSLESKFYGIFDVSVHGLGIFIISSAVSFVSTLLFESPIIQVIKTFVERRPAPAPKKAVTASAETKTA